MRGVADVGVQHPQTANQRRHLWGAEGQQLCLVDQQCLGGHAVPALEVVAKAIGDGLEKTERLDVRLLLARVHASRRERYRHAEPGIFRGLFNTGAAGQHDQVRQRDFLAVGLGGVELIPDPFEGRQHLGQLLWLVGCPILLWGQAQAATVGAAAFVGTTEGGSRGPRRRHKL
ncbi:hypothetical protein D3C84_865350 [compost metagenome]